jgi:transposase
VAVIPAEMEAKILRLFHAEGWSIGTVARQIGVHHSTVRRVLAQAGVERGRTHVRRSSVDPFVPFITETLEKWPTLPASALWRMAKARGYPGGQDYFRSVVARFRPRPAAEAYLRLRTLPGEQAQVDWAHFGRVPVGRAMRPLSAFLMVLSWSRALFVRFFFDQRMSSFLQGHVEAFAFLGGVPRVVLYDNLKSAVAERVGDAIRFNETLLTFAGHHRYEPRPVAPYRGNEKGRVERSVRYLRGALVAVRTWTDLGALNAAARAFCLGESLDRRWPDDHARAVHEVWEEEKAHLLALPDAPFPTERREQVEVRKQPYLRFDLNDYTVPFDRTRRTLVVLASETTVRIFDGTDLVAVHPRSWDKGKEVELPEHVQALVDYKRQARRGHAQDRLVRAVPAAEPFLVRAGERGHNLGALVAGLLRLLDAHGALDLERAVHEALDRDTPHLGSVRQVLDRNRAGRGLPPPVPVELPDDPRVRDLVVRPHNLDTYDVLANPKEKLDDDDDRD